MYVFDATPLIYLATVERLALLADIPSECVMPERVYDEVVTVGIEQGHADARRIEQTVEDGPLKRRSVAETDLFERLQGNDKLSDVDVAVLTLAGEAGATAIMDEQYGRNVAAVEGIETRGTAYLVLRLLQEGTLSLTEARATIDEMIDGGWYCAPNLYAKLVQKIEEFE